MTWRLRTSKNAKKKNTKCSCWAFTPEPYTRHGMNFSRWASELWFHVVLIMTRVTLVHRLKSLSPHYHRRMESITRETIESTCKKLCKSLQTKYKYDTEELRELKENETQLIQTYCTRAMPHLKIIEKTITKYISIPKNVLLEEDKCQSIQYTEEEYKRLEEHLENLQQRAKRATILNAALKEELATVDKLQNYINKSNEMCNIIENSSVDQNINSDMFKVFKHYEELYKKLLHLVPKTEKVKYNPFEDFKGNNYDFDCL
ncbi:protein MIS12 [Vespula squamosa]|uniref:Protein MIS12 n=1 Tax=Vespula squamosa TaxID=30214 RepID=A0ABD2AAP5_VESSQ